MASKSLSGEDKKIRPIVAIYVSNLSTGVREKIYALLDTGSDTDIISLKLAKRLGLELLPPNFSVTGIGGDAGDQFYGANFQLESLLGNYACNIKDGVVGGLPVMEGIDVGAPERDLTGFSHLEGIVFEKDGFEGKVECVVGTGHADMLWGGEVKRGKDDEPFAVHTGWGWTLVGVGGKKTSDDNNVLSAFIQVDELSLREEVTQCFSGEFKSEEDFEDVSKQQRDALAQLQQGVNFDHEKGMYEAPLPFKGGREHAMERINAADSRSMAAKRLDSLRRNFTRFPEKKEMAFKEMKKFLEEGAVEEIVDDNDAAKADQPVWTLPVHVVTYEDKPGKCRFCMDARANANGTCLNCHLIGIMDQLVPIQQPCRDFRDPIFAATFDIKGFFHRVLVKVSDKDCFRFFFFGDRTMTWKKLYRWSAHIFGAASSPTVAAFVLRHHADQIAHLFEEYVVDTIKRRFYVDDGSGGKNDPEAYRHFITQMNEAMELGGFQLSKWQYSHPTLVGEAPVLEGEHLTKFLGLRWNLMTDSLGIAVDDFNFPQAKTPRQFIKIGAKIYDIEGWFAPFVITGRGLIQRSMRGLWLWDKEVTPELIAEFNEWASTIKHLSQYYIPRCWNLPTTVDCVPELHIFSDASEKAYGAVAYRVVKGTDGVRHSHIITAKGHVVPTDPKRASHHNSTPRLELVAAAKALDVRKNCEKLARKVEASGEKFSRTVMWTDSTTVLKWIFDQTSAPKGFVGNRVARIQDSTKVDEWYYVPSTVNPADLITRGIRADEPEKWAEYHRGPDFLRGEESGWPEMIVTREPNEPDPVLIFTATTVKSTPSSKAILEIAERKGKWAEKLFRIAAIVRAVRIWKGAAERKRTGETKKFPVICGADIRASERLLIKAVQENHMLSEKLQMTAWKISSPLARNEVRRSSSLYPLNPFLGADDLIRVGSRLVHANINDESKFPSILPKKDSHVDALIRQVHHDMHHAGPLQVHSALRRRFWIIYGLPTVKRVLSKCPECQKATKAPQAQKMAPLPESRVVNTHAWDSSGVDMMGPFLVKKTGTRAQHKIYVAVFTCFQSRSVHVEIVQKMDADSFIMALNRFTSRRPGLRHLFSDNGSNFVGSCNILSKRAKEAKSPNSPPSHIVETKDLKSLKASVQPRIVNEGVDWTFLPPYASHYAGVWERVVGMFKKHLSKISSGDILHEETFRTVIVQIEGIVNDRPLTAMPTEIADISEMRPLRPRQILNPAFIEDLTPNFVAEKDDGEGDIMRARFKAARARVQAFWATWKEDYLSSLANRKKWKNSEKNLKEGDLCQIVDDTLDRSKWQLGLVESVDNEDGHARKIFLRRPNGKKICRDRTKLVLLELDGGS